MDPIVRLAAEIMQLAQEVDLAGFEEEALEIDATLNQFLDLRDLDT